ncbi:MULTISPECIES: J domain-containing protein [Cyanophyceae]|uniref:J domain-containing protein n=1 Tax=Cyanophyceae TaxID=3028117 RepID=UPI0016876D6B|nr:MULTISPECIES: J domain-containing protein [Cyanophyceae]MBD1917305.1 J domain-containing protein [Phormidium sp. FACHB-77]MBD2032228.1 J domain-containing protein [Phormidium sp. FACHB-322]MBD2053266.1 J domain-containing protein [Leptolyngbya sp. FACHB-60]
MPDANPRPKTHYDQLGVKPTASPQQIRRAFRDLSKLYHPDTTDLPATEATEKFQQLNEAYAILSSPDRRWTYDQKVGYSRISVMQPLEPLSRPASPQRREPANMYLDPTDRPLSAGEIFALFILGLTFVACLALVVTVSLTRGNYTANLETLPAQTSPDIEVTLDQQLEPKPSAGDTSLRAPSLPEALPSPKFLTSAPPTWL